MHDRDERVATLGMAARDEVAAARARVATVGPEAPAHRGGSLVRDPWETAVAFRVG